MNTALVTGAAGFIGSHLVEHLVEQGVSVRAFVRYNSRNHWGWLETSPVRDQIQVIRGDIRDLDSVTDAMRGVDTVLHLAALIGIPYSYTSPLAYIRTNVEGTYNVVQAARTLGVSRVVHTSTSEVYGSAQYVPIDESHPLVGQSPYSASKIGADQMALSFYRAFELPVVVLRPFNAYGPRQSARAVIPTIIAQVASGARSIQLGTLEPTRDFTFVTDTAAAFAAAATSEAAVGQVINAGSGFEISIGDLARLIGEVMGVDLEVTQDPARIRPAASEVQRLFADSTRARELMGWTPAHGGLEGFKRGIAKTAAWFADPAHLAIYKADVYNT